MGTQRARMTQIAGDGMADRNEHGLPHRAKEFKLLSAVGALQGLYW